MYLLSCLLEYILHIFYVGYFLNPEFYYCNAELHTEAIDTNLRVGSREVLKRLLNPDDQIDAIQEVSGCLGGYLRKFNYAAKCQLPYMQ